MLKYIYLISLIFGTRVFAKGLDAIADAAPEAIENAKVPQVAPQVVPQAAHPSEVKKEAIPEKPIGTDSKEVLNKDDKAEEAVKKIEVKSEFVKKYENRIFLGTGLYINKLKTADGDFHSDGSADAFFLVDTQNSEKISLRVGLHYVPVAFRLIADSKSYKGTAERIGVPVYFLAKKSFFSYGGYIEPSYDRLTWINDDRLDADTSKVQYQVGVTVGLGAEFKLSERVYLGPRISKSFGYIDNLQMGISSIFML